MPNRDYSSPGLYFVTICADFKRCMFGKVTNAKVQHSVLGRVVEECWVALSSHFTGIRLHAYVVMPNHLHGIIEICPERRAQQAARLQREATLIAGARSRMQQAVAQQRDKEGRNALQAASLQRLANADVRERRAPSLSIIVRAFKADVTRRAGLELGWTEEIWQHNYYDRVIRDGREFSNAMRYIAENPLRWQSQVDKFDEERQLAKNREAQQAAPLQRHRV